MRPIYPWMSVSAAFFLNSFAWGSADTTNLLDIGTYPQHIEAIKSLSSPRECKKISEQGFTDNQVVNEAALLCLALDAGGIQEKINWTAYPVQSRAIRELSHGNIVSGSYAFWNSDYDTSVYKSLALLKKGEFSKGIYTRKDNVKLLKITDIEQLRQFDPVTNHNWIRDRQILDCLNLGGYHTENYLQMFKMVNAKHADYLLSPFSTQPDQSQTLSGITLYPVPNMQLIFNDSLHFFVSKSHPKGNKVFKALTYGLKKLRQQGTIKKAYMAAGFLLPQQNNWKKFGCSIK